ncbi:protein kinase [Microtetraspora sp. AC03309]|uniref:serine/threonine-protein kinase n=1 Tax=Microtetraspora sp. AC03309 TaxID=2779376 RepID=UPI001E2BC23D|nr:serine/threonine-protein kinase [Microtetraspora sp. AC03309]MCC5578691.1 protein kinase [Microtetraspora sp. AC03309]
MSRPSPLRPEDPRRLGDYILDGRLGAGGQGVVFLSTGPDGSPVAVKLLHARLAGGGSDRRRFVGEIQAVRRVAPFCTAQVLDADLDGDRPYIVSEYVDGVSLQQSVTADGPRSDGALDRVAVGTATALAAIHRAGVAHRDFKPGNVLIGADGPRVIDFGISRLLDATTTTGGPVGTPAYLAPEQLRGEPVGPAGDMFSWALTMAYAASGRHAFAAETYAATLARILYGTPDLDPLGGSLREIVIACLAGEPRDRPGAEEVLSRLLGGGTAATVTPPARMSATASAPSQVTGPAPSQVTDPALSRGIGSAAASAPSRGTDSAAVPAPMSGPMPATWETGTPDAIGGPFVATAPLATSGETGERAAQELRRTGRRRWLPVTATLTATLALLLGVAIFLTGLGGSGTDTGSGTGSGTGSSTGSGAGSGARSSDGVERYAGMWIGVARFPQAARTFPMEIYLSGSSRMRWGADLHCEGRLTRTGEKKGDLILRLDHVTGTSCHPGIVVFSATDDRAARVDVIRSGDGGVAYSGSLARDS